MTTPAPSFAPQLRIPTTYMHDGTSQMVRALQDALLAGEQSGEPRPFDGKAFLARMHAEHGD